MPTNFLFYREQFDVLKYLSEGPRAVLLYSASRSTKLLMDASGHNFALLCTHTSKLASSGGVAQEMATNRKIM